MFLVTSVGNTCMDMTLSVSVHALAGFNLHTMHPAHTSTVHIRYTYMYMYCMYMYVVPKNEHILCKQLQNTKAGNSGKKLNLKCALKMPTSYSCRPQGCLGRDSNLHTPEV